MKIHGKEYTEVKDRIPLLLEKYPQASIRTEVYWHNADFSAVCMKATIICGNDDLGVSTFTGFSYEERTSGVSAEVNATSWVENSETSAIGRALANMNIGVNGVRPSAEEMQKVERMTKPAPKFSEIMLEMEADMKEIATKEMLALWAKENKKAIGSLAENEQNILRKLYKEREVEVV
jgi:hypothetical protein